MLVCVQSQTVCMISHVLCVYVYVCMCSAMCWQEDDASRMNQQVVCEGLAIFSRFPFINHTALKL